MFTRKYTAYIISILLAFILFNVECYSQNSNKLSSFEGRNFYVAFMQNEIFYTTVPTQEPISLELFMSSSEPANVVVKFQNITRNIHIVPNTVEKAVFGREVVQSQSEYITNLSVQITSDVPITIYGINSIRSSSDMFSAIPTMNWGKEYVIMSYPNDYYKDPQETEPSVPRKSQFCIISAEDNTVVTITPSVTTALGKPAGQPFSITLNKGQTYLVQSSDVKNGGDLTCSHIYADKNIGVMSGHVRTAILQNLSPLYDTKDHLVEMMTPVNSWGNKFVTIPFIFQNKLDGNLFRVTAKNPGTVLNIKQENGDTLNYVLNGMNNFLELQNINSPAVWTAGGPIQIMQYMKHTGYADNSNYDPSMCLVPPVEQFVQKILVQVPDNAQIIQVSNQYEAHKAMIVMEKSALSTFRFDDAYLQELTSSIQVTNIPGTDYYWARFPVSTGSHLFICDSGRFSGVLYGYGKNDSYSVIMGSSLLPVGMSDTVSPIVFADSSCGNIRGYVYEKRDTVSNSGIDYLYVNKKNTVNFATTLGSITDTSTYVNFSGNAVDDSKIAFLEILGRDRAGNPIKINYNFYPLIAELSNGDMNNDAVDWHDVKCKNDLWVKNNSKVPYTLISISSDNPKVTITPSSVLPKVLMPGETFNYKACASPNGEFVDIKSTIKIRFNCSKELPYNWNLRVNACELSLNDQLNFGDVYLATDSCKETELQNTGKFDITITDIKNNSSASGVFNYKAYNNFPMTIAPGEKKYIKICFRPTDKINYSEKYEIIYNCDKKIELTLLGKGISSELNDISYDFGKVRVGKTVPNKFTLTNTGNTPAPIKYHNIVQNDPSFNISEFQSIDKVLQPGEQYSFTVYFTPNSVGKKSLNANYVLKLDKDVIYSMDLKGEGIEPSFSTKDNYIGEIVVFNSKDTVVKFLNSEGTDNFNINKITLESGDISQFNIDLSKFNNLTVKPGDSLILPVKYQPQSIGNHEIILKIEHNAAKDGTTEYANFKISAKALPLDTLSRIFKIRAEASDNPCDEIFLYPKVINSGNVSTTITKIEAVGTGYYTGNKSDTIALPYTLESGKEAEFKYKYISKTDEPIKLVFTVYYDNKDTQKVEYQYTPTVKNLILVHNSDIKFEQQEVVDLTLQGEFPHKTFVPVTSSLRISTNPQVFRLIDGNYILKISNNLKIIEIPLVLFQKNDYFDIPLTDTLFLEDGGARWKIDLKFKTYFKAERFNPINISFTSKECFNPAFDTIMTEMTQVCIHNMRDIELITMPKVEGKYRSLSKTLEISLLNYIKEQSINIEIYDVNGKLVYNLNKYVPKIGDNQIKINLQDYPDGLYFYKVTGLFINESNKFIK